MTPLAKKLLVKPGQRWLILYAPENYLAALEPLPDQVSLSFEVAGDFSGIQLFIKNSSELAAGLAQITPVLKDETVLWIMYPKKNSGIATDLEMMGSWDVAGQHGLRPVASAAINDVWTTLRFRPEHLVKKSDSSKEALKKDNDYSAYIDADKKQITLPGYLQDALAMSPTALQVFARLAWSHKKEYVVWILSAKQEQTKANRITKMVEMLDMGKKNPSDK